MFFPLPENFLNTSSYKTLCCLRTQTPVLCVREEPMPTFQHLSVHPYLSSRDLDGVSGQRWLCFYNRIWGRDIVVNNWNIDPVKDGGQHLAQTQRVSKKEQATLLIRTKNSHKHYLFPVSRPALPQVWVKFEPSTPSSRHSVLGSISKQWQHWGTNYAMT
jgi:hypothetical protein